MKIQNPILKGFNPDPSICKKDNTYFIATSTFEWFPGVQIHSSQNLVDWELITRPLDNSNLLDLNGNPNSGGVWAPCLTYYDNVFYLVYTNTKTSTNYWKDTHNYLVTSTNIYGPWSKPIHLNSSGFDPSLFHEENGRKWLINMVWDHRESKNKFGGIVLQEYSYAEQKLVGKKYKIFEGTELGCTEGPHLYKHNGYYYLLTAEGGTGYNHAVTIARSKSIFGPYEVHPENPILTSMYNSDLKLQKSGHADIFQDNEKNWFMVHLCSRPIKSSNRCPLGRETGIQKVIWKNNWPYLKEGIEPLENIEIANIEISKKVSQNFRDDFRDEKLNINFQSLRIPIDESWISLKKRKNFLRIYGQESLASKHRQSLIGFRQTNFSFTATTAIDFKPQNFQQFAGIALFYSVDNFIYLTITFHEEFGIILDIIKCEKGTFCEPIKDKIKIKNTKELYLKMEVDIEKLFFYYSYNENEWIKIKKEFDSSKISDDYIGGDAFTGSFIALCCQDISGERINADFDWFEYIGRD